MPAPVWPCCHLSTLIRGILLLRRDSLALPRQQARSREPTKKGCREERLNIRSNRLRYHHSRAGSARSRHPTASRRYETLILGPRSTLEWLPPPAAPHRLPPPPNRAHRRLTRPGRLLRVHTAAKTPAKAPGESMLAAPRAGPAGDRLFD